MDFETKTNEFEIYECEKGGNGVGGGGGAAVNNKDDVKEEKVYLVETFYITSKKNNVFQVKLTSNGLCLHKESNSGTSKEQLILLKDIIGCRCLRATQRRVRGSCTCSSALQSPTHTKIIEENPAIAASSDINEDDVSAYLYIYAYIIKKNKRNRTTLTLRFRSFDKYDDNNREAQKWRTAIKHLIKGETPLLHSINKLSDTRKVLVLLNPKSGPGKARETFQKKVIPLFVEAEIGYELHVTKQRNFAKEFVRLKNVYTWKSIICIGGDGIYWEVVNGIMEREDWEQVFNTIPIGVVPCGSGNGLAKSIAHKYGEPFDAKNGVVGLTMAALKGRTEKMDLVRIETKSQIMFSFLSCGWGLISDVDIESERLRSIGYQRFTLWSVHRLINLRSYRGKISYIPIETTSSNNGQSPNLNSHENGINEKNFFVESNSIAKSNLKHSYSCNDSMLSFADCHIDSGDGTTDALFLETSDNANSIQPQRRQRLDSWYSVASKKSAYYSTTESVYQSIADERSNADISINSEICNAQVRMFGPASNIPALTGPIQSSTATIQDNWVHEEGQYIMVHAAYQTHLGSDCFFVPSASFDDGIIWLLIIRAGVSRSQLLSFMLGLSSGTHLSVSKNDNHFQLIPVKAFRIEPLDSSPPGNLTVDGESVEYGPIQGEIFPRVVNLLVPDTGDC